MFILADVLSVKRSFWQVWFLTNVNSEKERSCRGVFRGGAIGPWPPFGSPGLQKLHRKVNKIEAWPPSPLQVGHQALGSKSTDFGRKMGRNLSEDLFFFALHLILGEKWDEIWVWQCQILIYVPFKFSEVSGPPLFKILRTLLRSWKCFSG